MQGFSLAVAPPRRRDVGAATVFEWRLFWRRRRLRGPLLLCALSVGLAALVAVLKTVDLGGLHSVIARSVDILPFYFAIAYLGVLIVVVPLMLGAGLVAREVEAGTLAFLFVRPLSRASLLLGKCLGAWLIASVLLAGSFALVAFILLGADRFAGAGSAFADLPAYLAALVAGSGAYTVIFTLVGLLSSRPGLVGLFLAFGWENLIPYMPGLIRNFTVRFHLATLLHDANLPQVVGTMAVPSVPTALAWLVGISLAAAGIAALVFARRDYP